MKAPFTQPASPAREQEMPSTFARSGYTARVWIDQRPGPSVDLLVDDEDCSFKRRIPPVPAR